MKTWLFAMALLLGAAAPAWAEGYLSHYSSGGGRYLSDYNRGSYHGGYRGGYKYYGGPSGRIERKHGRDWQRYQEALQKRYDAVEPGAGPASWWGKPTYNPMGIALGWPRGSRQICGTYNRKPALCYNHTMRYDPLIHGE